MWNRTAKILVMVMVASILVIGIDPVSGQAPVNPIIPQLHNGELVQADYWRDEPIILSAGMGFGDIIGLSEITEETVRAAGGSWYGSLECTSGEEPASRTSAAGSNQVALAYKGVPIDDDGLPIVFSWPVATETVDLTDFQFTLNTGDIVFANSIGMWPNWELNERNVVVAFSDFGNRGFSTEDDVIFPVRLDIVEDDTPLLLVGPGGKEFNAVGLSWETDTTPYDVGPSLVGAKLNHVGEESLGEGAIRVFEIGAFGNFFPNDEFEICDEGDFRIRILTTGGFSPDGVTAVTPDDFENFFRVHVNGPDGETVLLEEVGVEYEVAGGTLRVVGLSELGQRENPDAGIYYDDCYEEDRDNYIDIILVGDEEAARNVTFLEIPSLEGGYGAFYNPGGPGPEPYEDVRYNAPGPPDLEPVIIALDDPMRVDRAPVIAPPRPLRPFRAPGNIDSQEEQMTQPGYRASLYDTAWPTDMANLSRSNSVVNAGLPRDVTIDDVAIDSVEMPYPVFAYTREEDEVFVIGGTSFVLPSVPE